MIVKMSKVEIVGPRELLEKVLYLLQESGHLQIEPSIKVIGSTSLPVIHTTPINTARIKNTSAISRRECSFSLTHFADLIAVFVFLIESMPIVNYT